MTSSGDINDPRVGDTLDVCSAGPICEGGRITYYRLDPAAPGGKVIVREPQIANGGGACTYTMVINDANYSVYAQIECPDPASPTGYGEPLQANPTPIILAQPDLPGANVYGTYSPTGLNDVTISGVDPFNAMWTQKVPPVFGTCALGFSSGLGVPSTSSHLGVTGFRVTGNPVTVCGTNGFNGISLEVRRADGTWVQLVGSAGGTGVFIDYIGDIEIFSSAPDAIPAYLGNFGGTSTPP